MICVVAEGINRLLVPMPLPTGPLLSILRCQIEKGLPSTTLKSISSRSSIGRPRKLSLDYILDRALYVLTTGVQWRHLPVKHGSTTDRTGNVVEKSWCRNPGQTTS
eukprot:3801844-Prorocentrum_lima.AAC.1